MILDLPSFFIGCGAGAVMLLAIAALWMTIIITGGEG